MTRKKNAGDAPVVTLNEPVGNSSPVPANTVPISDPTAGIRATLGLPPEANDRVVLGAILVLQGRLNRSQTAVKHLVGVVNSLS